MQSLSKSPKSIGSSVYVWSPRFSWGSVTANHWSVGDAGAAVQEGSCRDAVVGGNEADVGLRQVGCRTGNRRRMQVRWSFGLLLFDMGRAERILVLL